MLRIALAVLLLGVAFAAGLWLSQRPADQAPSVATELPSNVGIPPYQLFDEQGQAVDETFFKGSWDLVFFGFTNCPDVCPVTLQQLSLARQALVDKGQDLLPRIVLVSVDPERDTPEKLAEYTRYFGEDVKGLTGSLDELKKLTSALGIYFNKMPPENGNYNVDHSAVVLVINPNAEFSALFSAPHNVEAFVSDLPLLMR